MKKKTVKTEERKQGYDVMVISLISDFISYTASSGYYLADMGCRLAGGMREENMGAFVHIQMIFLSKGSRLTSAIVPITTHAVALNH